jgi:hypothetical protein
MTTLSISDNDALKEYPSASPVIKTILETSFGKAFFSQKITDRVKSFEDACNVLGISTNIIGGTADEIAYRKLKIIIQALNEGWTPNWNDTDEPKYYPWFYQNAPGFRLATSFAATSLRLSAPAFASVRVNWQNTPWLNSLISTKHFSPHKN